MIVLTIKRDVPVDPRSSTISLTDASYRSDGGQVLREQDIIDDSDECTYCSGIYDRRCTMNAASSVLEACTSCKPEERTRMIERPNPFENSRLLSVASVEEELTEGHNGIQTRVRESAR